MLVDRIYSEDQIDAAILLVAGLALVLSALVIAWPYLRTDTTAQRLRRVRAEQLQIRNRGRAATARGDGLIPTPDALWGRIVGLLRLDQGLEDGYVARRLRLAGFRGMGPVYAYLAARALLPFAALVTAALYLFVMVPERYAFTVELAILVASAAIGHYMPVVFLKNRINKRRTAIIRAWPDALDLLLICIESGMTIEAALRKVAEEISFQSIDLAEEISLTVAELSYLQQRDVAYKNFGDRTGSYSVRAVAAGMMQSEKYGTSLGTAIRVLAQEQRDRRMTDAEKKAASLPPKLTVPMILFFLPVLFVIILTPAAIEVLKLP